MLYKSKLMGFFARIYPVSVVIGEAIEQSGIEEGLKLTFIKYPNED